MTDAIHLTLRALHFIGIGLLIVACIAGTCAFLFMLFDPMIEDIERKNEEYARLVETHAQEGQEQQ